MAKTKNKKRKIVKQELGTARFFDWKEKEEAEDFYYEQKGEGYRIFDVAVGSDTYGLISAKRRPTKRDLERLGLDSDSHKHMKEIKHRKDLD